MYSFDFFIKEIAISRLCVTCTYLKTVTMPPVRWKVVFIATVLCFSTQNAKGSSMHDPLSMTSDGWRPIIGNSQHEIEDEITLYKNPTQNNENSEPIKAQPPPPVYTPPTSTSTKPYQTITATQAASSSNNNINNNNKSSGKNSQHQKHQKPFHLTHTHGPHIPLTPLGYKGSPLRIPIPNKHMLHMVPRPIRGSHGPVFSHSMRNEVIIPAPSAAIGTFAFYNHPPGFTKKPFAVLHGTNDVMLQHIPVQTYLLQNRNPIQIEGNNFFNQNDEYTRNLVPPPYKEHQTTKEKPKTQKPKERPTVATEPAATINNPTLVIGKHKDRTVPDNIVVQLPPAFEASQFQFHSQLSSDREPVEIQVTKEKLNVFHNSVPNNYNPNEEYIQEHKPIEDTKIFSYEISQPIKSKIHHSKKQIEVQPISIFETHKHESVKKVSEAPHFPTYEVTEDKQWQESPPLFFSTKPSVIKSPPINEQSPQTNFVFLPTPYRPDSSVPTSSTQNEVASIYSKLNLRNRQHANEHSTVNPNYFDIKEVSTHYPIVGKPETPTIFSVPTSSGNTEFPNEITVINDEKQVYQYVEEPVHTTPPTTLPPVRDWQSQRPRPPSQRRRRPLHRTTTEEPLPTEDYSFIKSQSSEEHSHFDETQKPKRRRRPSRVRTTHLTTTTTTTTEIPQVQTSTTRHKHRIKYENHRIRPTATKEVAEELPTNHKLTETFSYSVMQPVRETFVNSEVVQESQNPDNHENVKLEAENLENPSNLEHYSKTYENYETKKEDSSSDYERIEPTTTTTTETTTAIRHKIRQPTITTIIETQPTIITTRATLLDHHFDQTNHFESTKDAITIQEVYNKESENTNIDVTTALPLTTITENSGSQKTHRIRTRPIYENKNRPRFSVKEYRQRLNQYSSTSSTEAPRSTTESVRGRFPSRSRKPSIQYQDEEPTERSKFTPKEPRHSTNSEIIIEKKVNTRLRPFGRQKTTTEAYTTTQKLSIKPNIFSNLRRPPPVSLKQRIYGKYNRTNVPEKSQTSNEEEAIEKVSETTLSYTHSDISTNTIQDKVLQIDQKEDEEYNEEYSNTELMKNDALLQSQRVSDLTSSAHKEYETPGLFKSVSPNTRIVPSYFTLSTDDPILPIEAFFPNLKDRNVKNDS
ncbi:hypothetical protein RN001_001694 [Aquatica leii]|uniref:Uncharacterized protein n=1 Tax=Aquatica leii TaxID=1421715 RepID=A0AAN7QN11_9COLE|nr:hypothetical protein RN001_001694 [Aquatica leii]